MSLLFAEHSVTVYARTETADATSKVVPVPAESAGVTLTVQIEPIRDGGSFDSRTGVELMNPYRMFVEPEDIASVPYGARVVWTAESVQFRVTTQARRFKGGGDIEDLDHGVVEIELLEKQA